MEKVTKSLQEPEQKQENLEQVKTTARISLKAKLSDNKKVLMITNHSITEQTQNKSKKTSSLYKWQILRSVRAIINLQGRNIPLAGFIAALFFICRNRRILWQKTRSIIF